MRGGETGKGSRRFAKKSGLNATEDVGPLQRTLVTTKCISGTVTDWFGQFGWIQPTQAVEHPLSDRHGGKIFFSAQDTQEAISGAGTPVTCFVYVDANGLGAMNVRPTGGPLLQLAALPHAEPQSTALATQRAPQNLPEGFVSRGSFDDRTSGARNGSDRYGSRRRGDRRGDRGPRIAVHQTGTKRGGYVSARSRQVLLVEREDVLERVHRILYDSVSQSVENMETFESEWSPQEMVRRIVKHFFKAAQSPELLGMPWKEAVLQCVDHAIQGYAATCRDKPWFFELDLLPALCAGIWEIVKESRCVPRARCLEELEEVAMARYEDLMDSILLEKAMWDATHATFRDDHVCSKIYKYLHSSYSPALQDAQTESASRRLKDVQRVELFMTRWMENSMGRAWQAINNSEVLLTQDTMQRLFANLVAPFGEEHPFSCVPTALTERIGRPPQDWSHVGHVVRQLLVAWNQPVRSVPEALQAPLPPPKRLCRDIAAAAAEAAVAAVGAVPPPTASANQEADLSEVGAPEVPSQIETPEQQRVAAASEPMTPLQREDIKREELEKLMAKHTELDKLMADDRVESSVEPPAEDEGQPAL